MVDPSRVAAAYRQAVGIAFEPWLGDGDWSLAAVVGRPAGRAAAGGALVGSVGGIKLATTGERSASAEDLGCRFVIDPVAA